MAKTSILHCSFCGRSRDEVKILIAGQEGHICENCVDHAQEIIEQELNTKIIQQQRLGLILGGVLICLALGLSFFLLSGRKKLNIIFTIFFLQPLCPAGH